MLHNNLLSLPHLGEAFISVKRNRTKIYPSNTIYLKNGQEFEIEIFNPTAKTKLAKISINGKLISNSGIVIKPGQRVYLERFLDSTEKFKFETYQVETGSAVVEDAIKENGIVTVYFYDEIIQPIYRQETYYPLSNLNRTGTSAPNLNDYFYTSSLVSSNNPLQSSFTSSIFNNPLRMKKDLKETGRVEKGSESDQSFSNYFGDFETYSSNVVTYKVLPLSTKPEEISEYATYCTECGTKNKGSKYKFCPKCGKKV